MDFSDALVMVAAIPIVGKTAESSIRALSGVERVIELIIPGVEFS